MILSGGACVAGGGMCGRVHAWGGVHAGEMATEEGEMHPAGIYSYS